ncbi:TIGR03545 family protein [Cellvibrio sp. ARAG 10.3]|uniref:TIGR03545 family protein n=1 Tax=Cellvibrio sp. ARAG 10.3 TaxID=3451358 RepID=UPI003F48AFA2
MIRKSGWLVFLALLATVLLLVYVFAGTAIRIGMVYTLEKAVGAEVNIDDVSLSLSPLALTIDDLQITNKDKPTHNTISFAKANAALEVWPALLGYYVVNDLSIDGLAYGTERRSPGKVYRGELAEESERVDLAEVLQLDLPGADELMARANLQTEAKGEALQEQASTQKKQLESLKSQLPNKDNLEKIQADIKALTDSKIENAADLAAKTEQLKKLQDTLKAERDKVRQVKQQLTESRDQLENAVTALRDASAADWQQLQQLANIGEGGLAPISQILLGDVWGDRIAQLESIYRLVKPYIPEDFGKGDAAEAEPEPTLPNRILPLPSQPYPDFLVRNARINWLIGGGEATISAQDITAQHNIINNPTRFNLDVQGLPKLAAFALNGDFAIREHMVTNMKWDMDGFALDSMEIGGGDNALNLAASLLNSTGSLKLVDNQIEQQAQVVLQQPEFSSSGNKYIQQLAGLLNQQAQIPLTLGATGLLSDPQVSVRSPLDRLLGDALLGEAKAKIAELETTLRNQLDSKLQEELGAQSEWLAMLNQQDGEADALQGSIDNMLNAKLASVKDNAKDRLKDSLRDRLGGDKAKEE